MYNKLIKTIFRVLFIVIWKQIILKSARTTKKTVKTLKYSIHKQAGLVAYFKFYINIFCND